MTDQEIRQLIENGVDRGEIEYVMMHDEIGSEFQDQLISLLAANQFDEYENAIQELILMGVLDKSGDGLTEEEETKLNEALNYVMDLDEPPKELPIQMQYLNNTFVMRKLFYNPKANLLEHSKQEENIDWEFVTQRGDEWIVNLGSNSVLSIDKNLDAFDFAILDVIYSLYCYNIRVFSSKWLDALLAGNGKRNPTSKGINRIEQTMDKLSLTHVKFMVNREVWEATPLLSVEKFCDKLGHIYYLHDINGLYKYAHEKKQILNVPSSYFDTSKLPKEFSFADTETAIVIKRRVIARVMRILKLSEGKAKLTNWNRISLIPKKDKSEGLFSELDLKPDVEGVDAVESERRQKQWRTKQKPMYLKVIRGTLENLKRQYVILDYEEHKDNDSKNPKDPVTGFDIICFNKSEKSALLKMRDEQKPQYVQSLLDKRHESKK